MHILPAHAAGPEFAIPGLWWGGEETRGGHAAFATRGHFLSRISATRRTSVQEPTTGAPDHELVVAMARGDERAASTLYDRHAPVLYGLALRMVREPADAEEVVIDAFGQAWRDAARYDTTRGSVCGWLTTIARTRALDLIRARGRRARVNDAIAVADGPPTAMGEGFPAPDRGIADREQATAVSGALGVLPDAQRRAIELAFFEGLTHQEVAERLGEPLGTVKTRIRLGMHKLRDALRGFAPEAAL